MKKYLVEFIGTFFLVLTVGMTVIEPGIGGLAPLAIGSALMIMVYAGGHVSGGHYNPAVTLAVWLRGRCSTADVPGYMLAQVAGGIAASFLALALKGNPTVMAGDLTVLPALAAELVMDPAAPGLQGCGVAVINPPWRFDLEAQVIVGYLAEALSREARAQGSVRWIVDQ